MDIVTVVEESRRKEIGDFYVPRFEIKIEGVGLPRDILRDVVQVTYKDDIREIDSFELTVNNWNTHSRSFKYIGSETRRDLEESSEESRLFKLFEPCRKEVEIKMGYLADLQLMARGSFTTMEPNFPSSGSPTLNVRGLNVLHQLRRRQYTYAWESEKPSAIAKNIATLLDPETRQRRFPLPIMTSDEAENSEERIEYLTQKNQYDIDFLLALARRFGYVVFVREGDPGARVPQERERHIYFGPSNNTVAGLRRITFELKWGISLVDFRPTLTTANQIRSVTVNGWDRRTMRPITETVTLEDRALRRVNRDLHELLNECDPREEYVVDEPVFTRREARRRAEGILLDRHKEIVKASGTCVGLPDLRAGQLVQIEGVGCRLSGTYFVTDTTHTINDSGYLTKFNARREDPGERT